MKSVVLCADEVSLRHPEHLGLGGESLAAQPWLRSFSEAHAAREALAIAQEVEEVWVVSNDQVEPINLAAAIKSDRPDRGVYLVSFTVTGSLLSRVNTARLDGVLGQAEFARRYFEHKEKDERQAREASALSQVRVCVETVSPSDEGTIKALAGRHAGQELACSTGKHCGEEKGGPRGKHESAGCAVSGILEYEAPDGREDQRGKHMRFVQPTTQGNERHAEARQKVTLMDQAIAFVQESGATGRPQPLEPLASPAQGSGPGAQSSTLSIVPKSTNSAFLLPVMSGSGGSGKSTIAVLSALLTQRSGLNTLLIDLDLQFGDMLETLGYEEALRIDELLAAPNRIKSLQARATSGPALLCAPRNIEQAEDMVSRLPELLDLVSPHFDVIVANTGSFWTDQQAVLLERCSRALFVVDQRPSSLRGCVRALDLCTRCGIAASPLVFAVNKCSKQGLYSSIDVSCALNGAYAKEIAWGGSQVEEMIAAGQAPALLDSRNALVESLGVMLSDLIPSMPALVSERSGSSRMPFLRMFMGRSREELPCR